MITDIRDVPSNIKRKLQMEKIVEQYQAQSSNIKGKHISFY
jgi:hypothetical protein